MKILVADDSSVDLIIVEQFLKELGHEVILGKDGGEALALYRQHQPDLVILDEVMPVMRGLEVARAIRESEDNEDNWVPIIFLSAQVTPDDIIAGIESGGDDYITKPIEQKILKAKLKAMSRISLMRQKLLDISEQLEQANTELQKLANIDGLTELANRRRLDAHLMHEVSHSSRQGQSLAVIMCDVDEFKLYNDTYGHLKGDDCLRMVANALKSEIRRISDLSGRYGGEEFMIILLGLTEEQAINRAEAIRNRIESLMIPHESSSVSDYVTISIGVYTDIPDSTSRPDDFVERADLALYASKQAGRNKVTGFSELPDCQLLSTPLHSKLGK
jgi:diguanylate cyclase (GGDEF)-like protein